MASAEGVLMGGIGNCCCVCPGFADSLPTISIDGMSEEVQTPLPPGWIITENNGQCCAEMSFVFDEEQEWTSVDGGDVMTYDKTTTYELEFYYVPLECGQVLDATFTPGNGSGGIPDVLDIPDEPAYVNCCPSPVVLNTRILSTRLFGGQRLVVSYKPKKIVVTIQLCSTSCTDRVPVTAYRWVVTSRYVFDGCYGFFDYAQQTVTTSNSNAASCWGGGSSVTTGDPFELPVPWCENESDFEFCRRLILDKEEFEEATEFGFGIDDTAPTCTINTVYVCDPCGVYATEICWQSDDYTAISEPIFGFCTPSEISPYVSTAVIPRCGQHRYKLYNTETDEFLGCFFWDPTTYTDIECEVIFTALLVGGGNTNGGYGFPCSDRVSVTIPECDPITYSCPSCPTGSIAGSYGIACRLAGMTEYIDCSGYISREACVPFQPWSVDVEWPA